MRKNDYEERVNILFEDVRIIIFCRKIFETILEDLEAIQEIRLSTSDKKHPKIKTSWI